MPNIPPPAALSEALALTLLPPGTRLSRVHSDDFDATSFNPTLADPHWGGGRFDATASDPYGFLYAGSDDDVAVCETLLRDLPLDDRGHRFLPRAHRRGRRLTRLVLESEARLVSLCDGRDLARLGQDDTWLVHAESIWYPQTRRWAQAIRRWAPDAQGLVWRSRRDPSKLAYVFFGDRDPLAFAPGSHGTPPAPPEGLDLSRGDGERVLRRIAGAYNVTLLP